MEEYNPANYYNRQQIIKFLDEEEPEDAKNIFDGFHELYKRLEVQTMDKIELYIEAINEFKNKEKIVESKLGLLVRKNSTKMLQTEKEKENYFSLLINEMRIFNENLKKLEGIFNSRLQTPRFSKKYRENLEHKRTFYKKKQKNN